MKYVLACDESGAKGYADQEEQFPGQIGVFAGLLVPEPMIAQTELALERVIAPHRCGNGKLHITDLPPESQAELRTSIYRTIEACRLPCFWYAIHVAGYHAFHNKMAELLDNAGPAAGRSASSVKTGSARKNTESLHVELFRGLYGHIVAYIEERAPGDVHIDVRTDRVDGPIAKSFRRQADRLMNDGPTITTVTGFDAVERKVVQRELYFDTKWPEEFRLTTTVTSLDLQTLSDANPIVVAADVLANGLHHHFSNRPSNQLYEDLNRPNAIAGFPLAKNLDTFWNWGGPDLIGDRMFRHPKAPTPTS